MQSFIRSHRVALWVYAFIFLFFSACTNNNDVGTTAQRINRSSRIAASPQANQFYVAQVEAAAQKLIDATPVSQRSQLIFPFDSTARYLGKDTTETPSFCAVLAWCLPGWGLQQCQMSQAQLQAMHQLFSLSLSGGGYQTLTTILNRQRVIGEMEEVGETATIQRGANQYPNLRAASVFDLPFVNKDSLRDFYANVGGGFPSDTGGYTNWVWNAPGLAERQKQFCEYTLAIFGTVGSAEWGFRFEGHHITYNMTFIQDSTSGETHIHTTPLFFGAFPMLIPETPYVPEDYQKQWAWEKGQVLMYSVAHHLRQFWLALPAAQRQRALIAPDSFPQAGPLLMDTPLPFMIASLDPTVDTATIDAYPHIDLQASALSDQARWSLLQAFQYYIGAMNPNIGEDYLIRINQYLQSDSTLTLSWAGRSLEETGSHHYSYLAVGDLLLEFLQGNQFAVQHDSTFTGNHVHSMLRDLSFDWADPMRQHHREDHQQE
ncbi:MAG: DUF3500 domain-containing protein [Bacteroidota bacterium]